MITFRPPTERAVSANQLTYPQLFVAREVLDDVCSLQAFIMSMVDVDGFLRGKVLKVGAEFPEFHTWAGSLELNPRVV
eukprot:scaffold10383_cov120-Skeletonema_dohrnii-CCMP3373.AAC.3